MPSLARQILSDVLIEPSLPENVGPGARVMNHMGVTDFRLVTPCDHLSEKARQPASNSEQILENARFFDARRSSRGPANYHRHHGARMQSNNGNFKPAGHS